MPHHIPDYLQIMGAGDPNFLVNRYGDLFDEHEDLPPGDHRREAVSSRMADVLQQLRTEYEGRARTEATHALELRCNVIESVLRTQGVIPDDMVAPTKLMQRVAAAELRRRGIARADLHSLGTHRRLEGAGSAEMGLRAGLRYWGRSY